MTGRIVTLVLVTLLIGCGIIGFFLPNLQAANFCRIVFFVMLVVWAIIGFFFLVIKNSLPETPKLKSVAPMQISAEAHAGHNAMQRLGFESVGNPMGVNTKPVAVLLASLHGDRRCFGVVYHSSAAPDKVAVDIVSMLKVPGRNKGESMLTTGNMAEGGTMPVPEGSMMQLFPGADPSELLQHHHQALQFLNENGIGVLKVKGDDFSRVFTEALSRIRSGFLGSPVWGTLLAVVRTFSKSSPCLGHISAQSGVRRQLQRWRRGELPR
ncbi:MAG: hypothetical protein ACR2NP_19185 [Pirellulaceae bacterium]